MGTKRVLVADLDARTVNIEKKLEEVVALTKNAGQRMEAAFTKIASTTEKSLNKTSTAMNTFSKRDLGMLANQLLYSSNITGRLGSQLGNLATGLATGGIIGAAFAGFSAIVNLVTEEIKGQKEEVSGLREEYDKFLEMENQKRKFDMSGYDKLIKEKNVIQEDIKLYEMVNKLSEIEKIQLMGLRSELEKKNDEIRFYVFAMEKVGFFTKDALTKDKEKTEELSRQYDIMDDIYQRMREMDDEMEILGDVTPWGKLLSTDKKKVREPKWDDFYKHIEKAQDPMAGLVSLSNQMASNFQFAGHTFVGQLSQAIAMVDSISNMILTVASIFGGGGGFGIGGLLGLIGLEKGGRVSNLGGSISYTKIPSFVMGGSYSTPGFAGPMAGGYPVMVHKNETLDVYNAGQTSKLEGKMDRLINAVLTSNVHLSRKDKRGGSIKINIGRREVATIVQEELNNLTKSGYNLGEF